MVMLDVVCAYCARALVSGLLHCAHCGAPAPAAVPTQPPAAPAPAPPQPATTQPTEKSAAPPAKSGGESDSSDPWKQWIPTIVIIVVVTAVAILVARQLSHPPDIAVGADPETVLPQALRAAALCGPGITTDSRVCVVHANEPLLRGGITDGRDLTFQIQILPRPQLATVVDEWRRHGDAILTEGTVIAAVGTSATALHANTATGLRLETLTFADPDSARTFLMRAGLTRQPL